NSVPGRLARPVRSDPANRMYWERDLAATARIVDVPPLSDHPGTGVQDVALDTGEPVPGAPQKGGDPAAPSGTATLLRLRPNRQSHLRRLPPQGLGHRLRVLPTFVV